MCCNKGGERVENAIRRFERYSAKRSRTTNLNPCWDVKAALHEGKGELETSGSSNPNKQVELATANVDLFLKAAGLRGSEDMYLLHSYDTDMRITWQPTAETLKKRMPNHKLW